MSNTRGKRVTGGPGNCNDSIEGAEAFKSNATDEIS